MGYKQNGFLFHSSWIVDRDRIGEWPDKGIVSRLLAPLSGEAMLAKVDRIVLRGEDAIPLESLAALDALVEPGGTLPVVLFYGPEDDPEVRIHITITRIGTGLSIGMTPAFMRANMREQIASWLQEWRHSLEEPRCRLKSATFAPSGGYPRPRPPHTHDIWHLGELDLYLDKSWHAQSEERLAVLAKIESARLPSSARRTTEGDLVRIAFGASPEIALDDTEAMNAARRAQEDWLTPLIPAERERGWNELGDRLVAVVGPDEKEPFTFYDPRYSVGYKAMIVDPESGEIDEEMWAELKKIARDKKLADGTEVKGVRLIFPVRENALQMHARAIADGFEMATYPGNPQTFWQVNPP
jgi:hypothetical protein